MTTRKRDTTLTAFAVLFAILALSNLLKPFQLGGEQTGFVFFGTRLQGTANAIAGPLFGIYLAIYAISIWRLHRIALPMGLAYAIYVVLNLVLFNMNNVRPPGIGYLVFGVGYVLVAVGISLGAAVTLSKRKADLG